MEDLENLNLKLTENLKLFQKDNEYVLDPSKDFYHNNIPKIASILEAIAIEVSNSGIHNKITDLHKKLYLHILRNSKIDITRSLRNFSHRLLLIELQRLFSIIFASQKNGNDILENSFLKHINLDKPIIELDNVKKSEKIFKIEIFNLNEFKKFLGSNLLNEIISKTHIAEIGLEMFFLNLRRILLEKAILDDEVLLDDHFLKFSESISSQCFRNEYCWFETEEETENCNILLQKILEKIKNNDQILPSEIFILGSYKELYLYKDLRNFFVSNNVNQKLDNIVKEQVLDFIKEEEISRNIKTITGINNKTSKRVQDQYENFPYPRWSHNNLYVQNNYSYIDFVRSHCVNKPIISEEPKKLLVAGCGTGRHPINIASLDPNIQIYAIDLSLKSLSYASRVASEMGIKNITWLHGDINELNSYQNQFDIIESVGVLHHMEDPKKGFNILEKKLKNKGLMKIGLYARSYRNTLKSAKKLILTENFNKDRKSIRLARNIIMTKKNQTEYVSPSTLSDFYSISSFIDLLMHEQELDFDIDEISKLIGKNFNFLGFFFNAQRQNLVKKIIEKNFKNLKVNKLRNWKKIENFNKMLFSNMYQFWIQKN